MRRLYPKSAYNLVSLVGVGFALFGLAATVILYLLDALSGHSNPYLGIFIFVIFPGVMVFGLLLIPFGAWRHNRRGAAKPLIFDLGTPHHRNTLITFVAGTSVFLLITTVGLYEGYHYTESQEFCGKVCHNVMEPEYTTYHYSSHAKVSCASCHIGPGAGWYVQSKISGARQVIKAVMNTYPRPIPTPIENLRPAQEVCEQCHWPAQFYPAAQVINDYFLSDEANTHWQIQMMVKVGGTPSEGQEHASGIHWHVDPENTISYVADHSRRHMERVAWTRKGKTVEYTIKGQGMSDSTLAQAREHNLERTLDCMDCHNRPAHKFQSPMEAVNEALVSKKLDRNIPWIKREAVKVLSIEYATKEGARDSITAGLQQSYSERGLEIAPEMIEVVQGLYARNMFPHMRARWDRYPDHIGHFTFDGCFRCHGSDLETSDGKRIGADCNMCHTILAQGSGDNVGDTLVATGLEFQHPLDIGGAEKHMACTECHFGDASLYLDPIKRDLEKAGLIE